jgi:hypothetical protein
MFRNMVPLGAWMETFFQFAPFHDRATGVPFPVLLLNVVPTAKHDFGVPQEILYPVETRLVVLAEGEDAAKGRTMDDVTAAEAEAVPAATPGTAMPETAASATSPDMTILRTRHLS